MYFILDNLTKILYVVLSTQCFLYAVNIFLRSKITHLSKQVPRKMKPTQLSGSPS